MDINWEETIKALAKERPIFHSEADFQFALAWKIKELDQEGKTKIILERPYRNPDTKQSISTDMIVIKDGKVTGIELKYVTAELKEEEFLLKNHAATGQRRYDVYADISRLEKLKKNKNINDGIVIFLTNAKLYKSKASGNGQQFNIKHNETINKGKYDWINNWADNSKKQSSVGAKRMDAIQLTNEYKCEWKSYSNSDNYCFEYIMFEI